MIDVKKLEKMINEDEDITKEKALAWYSLGMATSIAYFQELINTLSQDSGFETIKSGFEVLWEAANSNKEDNDGGTGDDGQKEFIN